VTDDDGSPEPLNRLRHNPEKTPQMRRLSV
jgi:hypothetical protein